MDIRKVKKLIDLLERSDINEIEIKEGDQAVRISRTRDAVVVQAPAPAPAAPPPAPEPSAGEPSEPAAPSGVTTVRSPMVGTFYAASSPGAAPFVNEGDTIAEDDVLCIIEAMKTMNQIKAPEAGVVVKVHPENGDPIQYNQPLVDIKTA